MGEADWYFDFISPYSYFALRRLDEFDGQLEIRPRPVLFAAILDHWGQKGPAEIPPKRTWAYRSLVWQAAGAGIPLRFPASHPFNPLPYLRLSAAAGSPREVVLRIFEALWTTGADPADPGLVRELARSLDIEAGRLAETGVKNAVRRETGRALEQGVFGVPTLVVDGHLFWGVESIDFAHAYLADPGLFEQPEMRRVARLPVGASRKRE